MIKLIDLFAGCGGMSLGFEETGQYDIILSIEKDSRKCDIYNRNLKQKCCKCITLDDLFDFSSLPKADVIIGGPPCQPFSAAGSQKGSSDKRDCMPVFIKAIASVRPRLFVMENVSNLATSKKHQPYFNNVMNQFTKLGYNVSHQIIDASDYGVPQKRKRLFIVGSKSIKSFSFDSIPKSDSFVSVVDLLGYETFSSKTIDDNVNLVLTPQMDQYILNYETKSKCKNPRDLDPNKPSRTLTCRNLSGCTSDMIRIRLDNGQRRQLTTSEAAKLQTFPDGFFSDVKSRKLAMDCIGNSVPPLLAKIIAHSLYDNFFL